MKSTPSSLTQLLKEFEEKFAPLYNGYEGSEITYKISEDWLPKAISSMLSQVRSEIAREKPPGTQSIYDEGVREGLDTADKLLAKLLE